jgi:hypothetical protein
MDGFEEQMRNRAPAWSAFDIRMMQGYLERGFVAGPTDEKIRLNYWAMPRAPIRTLHERLRKMVSRGSER